jgi:hypothetical protein
MAKAATVRTAQQVRAPNTDRPPVGVLVSYVYLEEFLTMYDSLHFRDWVLDSGAYSAHSLGIKLKLSEYIDTCKRVVDEGKVPVETFALDVISDWRASLRNTDEMWKAGIEAIPCFHYGEPWNVLRGMCRDYPKVAIGGCAMLKPRSRKWQFVDQVFARIWPKKLHGFGFGTLDSVIRYPFHSVDASNWEIGPARFATWYQRNGKQFKMHGLTTSTTNFAWQVDNIVSWEEQARRRWEGQLEPGAPTVRLALVNLQNRERYDYFFKEGAYEIRRQSKARRDSKRRT